MLPEQKEEGKYTHYPPSKFLVLNRQRSHAFESEGVGSSALSVQRITSFSSSHQFMIIESRTHNGIRYVLACLLRPSRSPVKPLIRWTERRQSTPSDRKYPIRRLWYEPFLPTVCSSFLSSNVKLSLTRGSMIQQRMQTCPTYLPSICLVIARSF